LEEGRANDGGKQIVNLGMTRKIVSLFLFVFAVLITEEVRADEPSNYYFRSLEVEDGLSQNMVYSIIQDQLGFMWFGTQDGLNRYDGYTFKVYKENPNNSLSIGDKAIFSLFEDDEGEIWVGTANGVFIYNHKFDSFTQLTIQTKSGTKVTGIVRDIKKDDKGNIWLAVSDKGVFRISKKKEMTFFPISNTNDAFTVRKIVFDESGNLWIATYLKGLYKLNPLTGNLKQFLIDEESHNIADNDINDLYLLDSGTLLLGTVNKGVQMLNLNTLKITSFLERDGNQNPLFVRSIFKNSNGELWFGTESGVYIYNLQTERIINLQHNYSDPYSISDNAIHSIYQDKEKGMWIGTFFGGVNYFSVFSSQFEKYYPINGKNSISGKSISEFCEDGDGNIWIGTEDAGINRFNPQTKEFSKGFLPAKNVHALLYDEDQLWVGTFSDGLFKIDLKSKNVKSYKTSLNKSSLNNNNIYSIYKDYAGVLWIGTMLGLHVYNEKTDDFTRINEQLIDCQVNDIIEDSDGILWFVTLGKGIFSYNKRNGKWENHYILKEDGNGKEKMIICILEDSKNRLWVGTEGAGLCIYNKEEKTFTNLYNAANGLPNGVIYKILEDASGNLWGSTNKGIFMLNPEKKTVEKFTHAKGLLGDQFNYKSGFKSSDGKIFFGGVKGFVAFPQTGLLENNILPNIVINSLQIYNKELEVGGKSILTQSIVHTKEINLPYSSSFFSVGFAALSYVSPKGNQYAYKLTGYDEDWVYVDQPLRVTYSNLSPGEYIFNVKASNSDGVWNENSATLKINILPPFYKSIWAYLFYIVLIGSIVYFINRQNIKKVKQRNIEALKELENNKEKELYDAKINFFTNITHEIRTPLSLIKAPLEEVIKRVTKEDSNRENLFIIQRNTNRLLKLVNELLDFRKVESKGLTLNFMKTEVFSLINEIAHQFIPTADLKGIKFELNFSEDKLFADIDREIFTKIVGNLFHNALNHAHSFVEVYCIAVNDIFQVRIINDGKVIPAELREKIFEPFFKVDPNIQGSGIGLPFSQSLVELYNGKIYLDKNVFNKTCFVLELPIHQSFVIELDESNEASSQNGMESGEKDLNNIGVKVKKKTILLVEDNQEFKTFLVNHFRVKYRVLTAGNGKEALCILNVENIDIIISDIMMPVMDGMQLCKEVKGTLKLSHIPIILLTAKCSISSKINGLKIGADEYIEKPFSLDYVMVRIENLLRNRKSLREAYKNSPETALYSITYSKADEEFLNKLVDVIHSNIEDIDLDVNKLASKLNMSRASLYRKVKDVSELTPNEFIVLIRLKKAAELLKENEYQINEVAFIVGFNSSSYFSKCFYNQFGILPKDFAKRIPQKV
jgi:ligand-binding sensor domain-containing protein/signal transduction histidine kinase/DNA-binding response OmpR family regulator